jgi:hypothetical protein
MWVWKSLSPTELVNRDSLSGGDHNEGWGQPRTFKKTSFKERKEQAPRPGSHVEENNSILFLEFYLPKKHFNGDRYVKFDMSFVPLFAHRDHFYQSVSDFLLVSSW